MTSRKDVMVEMNKEGFWVVRTQGSSKAIKKFSTQTEAKTYGMDLAKRNKSEIRIKDKSHKVRESHSYR